jgi:4-hydroxy-tetrahydrodipicolinate reductase
MKVGIFGFGKAGRAVASVLLQKEDVQLCWVIRRSTRLQNRSIAEFLGIEANEDGLIFSKNEWIAAKLFEVHPVDVIIDFSSAEGIEFYGAAAADKKIAIISAISDYSSEKIQFLKKISAFTQVLWSPNITLGINFLMLAAKVLKNIAPYTDIEIIEEHFKDKKETSGTAKKIAQALGIAESEIKSIRAGGIIGHHEILFGFPFQTVRLTHDSISREAFGSGALFAAMNIVKQEKGFYTMEDLLIPYFNYEPSANVTASPD